METQKTTSHTPLNQFTVMTCNLRFGLADDGINSWTNRQNAYPQLLKMVSPDFLGVQEANRFQGNFLHSLLNHHSYIGMRNPAPDYWQNNLIFYPKNWTCRNNKQFFLSETPTIESKLPESKWPRLCTIGLFERDGNQLIHMNTHFDFHASVQLRSAEIIIDFLSDLPGHIPVILTGDFNTAPHTRPYTFFIDNGFQDVFENSHSSTFHNFTGQNVGDHIDWILFRGNLVVEERNIIRQTFNGQFPSDHFPVTATFAFP